jgi:putative redox protein
MQSVVARWSGSKVGFTVESRSGHSIEVDEPPEFGDDGAMNPTEVLLSALSACTGVNAVILLRKFRQRYRGLSVECQGEQQPDWPHAFTDIRLTFAIAWEDGFTPDESLVAKALDMACNRYCPVDATLTHGTKISHGYRADG